VTGIANPDILVALKHTVFLAFHDFINRRLIALYKYANCTVYSRMQKVLKLAA